MAFLSYNFSAEPSGCKACIRNYKLSRLKYERAIKQGKYMVPSWERCEFHNKNPWSYKYWKQVSDESLPKRFQKTVKLSEAIEASGITSFYYGAASEDFSTDAEKNINNNNTEK